jgi:dTDP-glucose 4,6-dehydratase
VRILVTGGRGTVGQLLYEQLRERGHAVVTIDLAHAPEEIGFSLRTDVPGACYARCDVGEYRQLERVFDALGPFDLVYHAAAEFGRWNGEDYYEALWRTNAVGTKNVIRLQEKHRFRLVLFSSSEVYGDWSGVMKESVLDEHPVHQMNDYAMSKWVNEMQVRNSVVHRGTESVILRLFNTYGPGEYYSPYRSVNCRFVYCALAGIPWVVFRGYRRMSTYLSDVARTIANISEHFHPGAVYNIGGGHEHSIEELSDLVLKVTGANPKLVEYRDTEVLTTRTKRVDCSRAVRELDHRDTVSLEEGLRRTADWMRGVYGLGCSPGSPSR